MEEVLRAQLLATAALVALVSDRVDWGLRPQDEPLPGVTLQTVGGSPGMTMTGPDGWLSCRVQADCWGRTYKDARDVRVIVSKLLAGLRLTTVEHKLRTFVIDQSGEITSDADDPLFRAGLDVSVRWSAAS